MVGEGIVVEIMVEVATEEETPTSNILLQTALKVTTQFQAMIQLLCKCELFEQSKLI